ncbi:hypothetical protein [Zhongshania sp.]|uniref:hypothetical protein n=1 Tax=Zhongshania sp. TaxID=1971902 RepID=UPI00356526A1
MRPYRYDFDADYLIHEYAKGRTVADLAREFGVSRKVIKRILQSSGVSTKSNTALDLPDGEIIAMYTGGASENATANHFGISRNVVARILGENGIARRTQSEAESLKWSQMSDEARANQVEAAHKATTGRPLDESHRIAKAEDKAAKGGFDSPDEMALHDMLVRRGCRPELQRRVGVYNCDLTVHPVAVEVWGGGFHFFGRHAARTPERVRSLFDAGLHVMVVTTYGKTPITEETADCVVRFIEAARANPAMLRQYRVIRGAGELLAACSSDSDTIPIKPTIGGCFDF